MKNQLKAAILGLFVASSMQAITISDTNTADVRLDANATILGLPNALYNPSYTGNFTPAPYNPGTEQITSAFVRFTIWDGVGPLTGAENWTMTLDGGSFDSGGSFTGFFNFGNSVTGGALLTLSDTGVLSYTITADRGSFWLTNAYLEAEKSDRVQGAPGVPDHGSSVLMLVGGLLAVGALRRGRFVA